MWLVCLPAAGSGTAAFRKWPALMPPGIGLALVRLPGRESRLGEQMPNSITDVVEGLAEGLRPILDVPYALFGHCSGAIIAFELARELRRSGTQAPRFLAVASHAAPHHTAPRRISHLPDADFLAAVSSLGGIPSDILDAPAILALVLPALRADFALMEEYQYVPAAPLACPIVTLAGAGDSRAPHMAGWNECTTAGVRHHIVEGGHFLGLGPSRPLIDHLGEAVAGISSRRQELTLPT